jgi:serine/threonine-protein kinase
MGPELPPFQIIAKLGRGTTGVVYQVKDLRLDRIQALKVLTLDAPADVTPRMNQFLREARILAGLTSKSDVSIPAIHEVGQANSLYYMLRDFVEGATLVHCVQSGSISSRAAAKVLATIAGAVERVHLRGVVHRNLHPANILIATDGTPKLIGFGWAAPIDPATPAEQTRIAIRSDVESLQGMLEWVFSAFHEPVPIALQVATRRGGVSRAAELESLVNLGLREKA